MRTALGVLSAGVAAALSCGAASAKDEDLFVGPGDLHTVLFGSMDGGRSAFVTAGFKHTPVTPLDRTGPLLVETNGYGVNPERYRDGDASLPALRFTSKAATLGGYQWALNGFYAAALIGPEVVHEQLTVDARILRVSQARLGVQGEVDLWADPTRFLTVNATLVAGSAQGSVYGRVAAGYRLPGNVLVGPEIGTYATRTYHELRYGGHLTGIPVFAAQLRLSGGWMTADDRKPGSPYVSLGAWIRM